MRVMICDDHMLFAESLAFAVEAAGHEVSAVVEHPDDALALLASKEVDAVVLDLQFPDANGLAAIPLIQNLRPEARIVVLSGRLDDRTVSEALEAGAFNCAEKSVDLDDVLDLLETARQPTAQVVGLPTPSDSRWERDPLARFLTRREREVFEALADGETTESLAYRFGVSNATIRTHVQGILSKLGVHSRLEAVAFALTRSLLPARRKERAS